jgi:hypothetical protein
MNTFSNDGSFMQQFAGGQEEGAAPAEQPQAQGEARPQREAADSGGSSAEGGLWGRANMAADGKLPGAAPLARLEA